MADTVGQLLIKMSALKGARVLLVEDTKLNQELARELIEQAGLLVDLAENGKLALALLKTERYDLVLMDRQMPILNGVAAARAIRKTFSAEVLPIVAMSADEGESERNECFTAGMNGYILKPIDPHALFEALLRFIPVKQAIREEKKVPDSSGSIVDTAVLASIKGLDYKVGLYHALNRTHFYVKLLRSFSESQIGVVKQIYSELVGGERENAQRSAHTLYALAATVGALSIAAKAKQLELAIKGGQAAIELQPLFAEAEKNIADIAAAINIALVKDETRANAQPGDWGEATKVLTKLEKLLAADRAEAVDLLEAAEPLVYAVFGSRGEVLVQAVKNYDFPRAGIILQELLSLHDITK